MSIKNILFSLVRKLITKLSARDEKKASALSDLFSPLCCQNMGLNMTDKSQFKVLIAYTNLNHIDLDDIKHANVLQNIQMISYFLKKGFCVDACDCTDQLSLELVTKRKYDIIIGQGKIYKKACESCRDGKTKKILYVTESFPPVVERKYDERTAYFKERHPELSCRLSPVRSGFFDEDMFSLSDCAIVMSSRHNIEAMRPYVKSIYQINANIIQNQFFRFDEEERLKCIKAYRRNFLWFGSRGLVHKGGDIVIDSFRLLPDCSVDFYAYGFDASEKKLFRKLKAENTNDCGMINVQGAEFIRSVVDRHCFIIMPSCSEGMNTSVATCMAHGIIPIVTKECGFEHCEHIILLEDYKVETICKCVKAVLAMSDEEVLRMSKGAYRYAQKLFSLENFDKSFRKIMDQIIDENIA